MLRDLVGRQVVVDVGDVDAERLVLAESRACCCGWVASSTSVLTCSSWWATCLPARSSTCARVVAHQVVQPPVVVAAVLAVDAEERVEPDAGLAAVADAEFGDVQLFWQRAPCVQRVPHRAAARRSAPRPRRVARVASAAGQRLLVLAAGDLLPARQGLPVQGVEPPEAAFAGRVPRFQEDEPGPARRGLLGQGPGDPRRQVAVPQRRRSRAISRPLRAAAGSASDDPGRGCRAWPGRDPRTPLAPSRGLPAARLRPGGRSASTGRTSTGS